MNIFHPFRDRRRKALNLMPFPPEWAKIIEKNVPGCQGLHKSERQRLKDLIKVFISEKHFEGCAGFVITDEVKVTVAAQACLLLLNLKNNYYDELVTILIYPAGFNFNQEQRNDIGIVSETDIPASGLCSSGGVIVLSWPDTIEGSKDAKDGMNVVFHEFAHQLDQLDGSMNGVPLLHGASSYRAWGRVLSANYNELREDISKHRHSVIRPYAATKPAEFFAVVTETFFEQPIQLQRDHPELYDEFKSYYCQDPAARARELQNTEELS